MPHIKRYGSGVAAIRGLSRAVIVSLALTIPAVAQEDADLDLRPADFLPDETMPIRVDALRPGATGSEVVVTVANLTNHSVAPIVECSLFDTAREDLGTVSGAIAEIASGNEASAMIASPAEGAKRAYCLVKDAR